jgi:uncharacterized lipoprotein YbaY
MSSTVPGNSGVRGIVRFTPGVTVPGAGTIHVRLLDVSCADAASTVIVERSYPLIGAMAAFDLPVGAIDPSVSYAVSVHIDVDGDGAVSSGDFVSYARHAVLTFGHGQTVEVEVRRVE